jgi:hypothetical protein
MNTGDIVSFARLLDRITPGALSADPYAVAYLDHLLAHRLYYLHIYADLLKRVPRDGGLVDFGCGNGLLGLFARHCGFDKVALVDVDEGFLHAASALATQLGIDVALRNDLPATGYRSLVGTDVVEHIYDLSAFMRSTGGLERVTLTTSANTQNWLKARVIKKFQRIDELRGTPPAVGNRWTAVSSFLEQRYTIIEAAAPGLDVAWQLAERTRGQRREDIQTAVKKYLATGALPPPPTHHTNTCDPETGSWTERLLYPAEYRRCFAHGGFTLAIRTGGYNTYEGGVKSLLLKGVNVLASSPRFAAYLILEGTRHIS